MGWLHEFNATEWKMVGGNRVVDRQKELDRQYTWDAKYSDGKVYKTYRMLKSAMVGSVYYGAIEVRDVATGSAKVCGVITLTCGKCKYDGTLWGHKDMDETMEPYYYDCPAKILALLTPTDDDRANAWRNKCRERLRKKAEERKNGPAPLYAPTGVRIWVEGKSWILSSPEYMSRTMYRGCRFSKAKWRNSDTAVRVFLNNYGTPAQKAEYAASGRECPPEWKTVAA